jgi:2-dehydropantoate 2-reductase
MTPYRYAIIGTGALGGLYGALLQRAGLDVHFLLRSDFDHVRRRGLRIDSHWGDFSLDRVNAYARIEDMPACDVVCICLKTTANHLLPEMLPRLAKPGCVVLLMQNGLGAEEEVAAILPQAKVGGAMCYLCANRVGPGHVDHVDYGQISFAPHSPGMDEALERILADFRKAGVPVERAADLKTARWRKLVWNIPYNGLSVVLAAGTDEIMRDPRTAALAMSLMREVIAGAQACGATIEESYASWVLDFTRKMKPYKTSMVLDFEAGRPLETEYIYRRPLKAAQHAGRPLPQIEMLTALLEYLDARNRSAARPPSGRG